MKNITFTGTESAYDIVHLLNNKDNFEITSTGSTVEFTSSLGDVKYTINNTDKVNI